MMKRAERIQTVLVALGSRFVSESVQKSTVHSSGSALLWYC